MAQIARSLTDRSGFAARIELLNRTA